MFRSLTLLFAGVALLALGGSAKSNDDLVRLDGKGDALSYEARYGWGGGWNRGWGGGGWNRGWGVGWGGGWNRGWGGGWNRGWGVGWGGGWNRGWGVGWDGGWNRGWGVGWGGSFVSPSPFYSGYYISPCAANMVVVPGTVLTLGNFPARNFISDDGTYPYDGGPRDGSFAPPAYGPAPTNVPGRLTLPREGRLVSLPVESDPYRFLAFGESPAAPSVDSDVPKAPEALRIVYPAYGESMPTFSAGVTMYRASLR